MGIVVLDHLLKGAAAKAEVVSAGGEISGSRASLSIILQRHQIPPTYLKECTTRQTHQDGQRLLEAFEYGRALNGLSKDDRRSFFDGAFGKLRNGALEWLNRQHLRISCDPSHTPYAWIEDVLDAAKGRSGGKVEQHLVGAKLSRRHPEKSIANHPGHAGDEQTGRSGDFTVGNTCYHVTASPGLAVIDKCKLNLSRGLVPVLVVPSAAVTKARNLTEERGLQKRLLIVSLEEFIAVNVVEMAEGNGNAFKSVMDEIVRLYNERLTAVETDLSLKIELD